MAIRCRSLKTHILPIQNSNCDYLNFRDEKARKDWSGIEVEISFKERLAIKVQRDKRAREDPLVLRDILVHQGQMDFKGSKVIKEHQEKSDVQEER